MAEPFRGLSGLIMDEDVDGKGSRAVSNRLIPLLPVVPFGWREFVRIWLGR